MSCPSFKLNQYLFALLPTMAFIVILLLNPIREFIDDNTTPQPWFSAAFDVPDYQSGVDPLVAYHLSVNRSVHGFWTASIYREEKQNLSVACTGGGYAYYDHKASGTTLMPLSRFLGISCLLPPGEYRICTNYDLDDNRSSNRAFGPFCDVFRVVDSSPGIHLPNAID